jgi:hypothetical protein
MHELEKVDNLSIEQYAESVIGSIASISSAELGSLILNLKSLDKIKKATSAEARKRINNGEKVKYCVLDDSAGSRYVESPEELYELLADTVSHNEFMSCVSVKVSDIEKIYSKNKKESNGTPLTVNKEELAIKSAGIIKRKPSTKKLNVDRVF